MAKDLAAIAKKEGIRYFLISFVDLFGVLRAKLVPAAAIERHGENRGRLRGLRDLARHDARRPRHVRDPRPREPDPPALAARGRLARGRPLDGGQGGRIAPRVVLKRQIAAAAKQGYRIKTGVECEYFIISPDGAAISDVRDSQDKPCYDQSALMRRFEVITAICDAMQELGWGPYQNDHEDANGQFEMNWLYADALVTADRHAFFKFMVKTIAERHGLRATFMPKPFAQLTGNGCHVHASLWDKDGVKNLFYDAKGELGLSQLAYHFLGGVLHSAEALCAIFNPTVNSYKRLNARPRCRARPGRPTRSATPATTAPTWCASPTPAASSSA